MEIIKKLRKQGKKSSNDRAKMSPIPHLVREQESRESGRVDSIKEPEDMTSSMRLKYQELLKVKREIVLPVHMKTLMEF